MRGREEILLPSVRLTERERWSTTIGIPRTCRRRPRRRWHYWICSEEEEDDGRGGAARGVAVCERRKGGPRRRLRPPAEDQTAVSANEAFPTSDSSSLEALFAVQFKYVPNVVRSSSPCTLSAASDCGRSNEQRAAGHERGTLASFLLLEHTFLVWPGR